MTATRKRPPAATAAAVAAAWKPTVEAVRICLDADLVLQIQALEEDLAEAQREDTVTNRAPQAPALAERILTLKADAAASEVEFRFRSLGRRAYTDLLRAHPPTAQQKADAGDGVTVLWNVDTYPPALLHACCVTPADTTLPWWQDLWDTWGVGQAERLWKACLAANAGVAEVPKARAAYGLIHGCAPN